MSKNAKVCCDFCVIDRLMFLLVVLTNPELNHLLIVCILEIIKEIFRQENVPFSYEIYRNIFYCHIQNKNADSLKLKRCHLIKKILFKTKKNNNKDKKITIHNLPQ